MSNNLKGTDTNLDPSMQETGILRAPSLPMANPSRTHLIPDQGTNPFLLFSSSLLVLTPRVSTATLICLGSESIQQACPLWHMQTDTWLLGTVSGSSSHFLLAVHALCATFQTRATGSCCGSLPDASEACHPAALQKAPEGVQVYSLCLCGH